MQSSSQSSFFSLEVDNPYLVRLGSCFGIPIDLHPTFFALLALSAFSAFSSGWVNVALVCVLYGPVLLCTIVTHELGHALMTQRLGASVGGIVLWPLGGLALCGATGDPWHDLKV
jgi:Zn-dependent protease